MARKKRKKKNMTDIAKIGIKFGVASAVVGSVVPDTRYGKMVGTTAQAGLTLKATKDIFG